MKIQKEGFVALVKSARTRILAAMLLTLICAGTVAAAALSSYEVEIVDGIKSKIVHTSETDALKIVEAEGYDLKEKDELVTNKFTPGKSVEDNKIVILRAHKIVIDDEGKKTETVLAARNVKDALKKAKVDVNQLDKVKPSLESIIKKDTTIKIKRAFTVKINVDGKEKEIGFLSGTVSDALKTAKITLDDEDEVSPALDKEIAPGDVIDVLRVSYREKDKTETIKYKTITTRTTSLYVGHSKTKQNGKNGEQIVTYEEKIVNGKVADAKVLDKKVTKEPVNCVKLVGSKVKVISKNRPISNFNLPSRYALDKDGIPTGVKSTITGRAKAYTCNYSSYKGSGRTATGTKAQPGYIAVDPRQIPYGTEMYIVSTDGRYVYGYCIAADTGGFARKKTATCDLYMDTLGECYQWGNKNVNIYILSWGHGRI